jgi:hypothetical protein
VEETPFAVPQDLIDALARYRILLCGRFYHEFQNP